MGVAVIALVVSGFLFADVGAAGSPPDFPSGYVFGGVWKPISAPATYRASTFPIDIRITVPTRGWLGAQWKANAFTPEEIQKRHLTCSKSPKVCAPPYFGWVTIGKPPAIPNAAPRALIIIVSSFARTPSVATTAAQLCHNKALTCQPQSTVTIGDAHGLQFGGQTNGAGYNYLIPFTPPSKYAGHAAGTSDGDAILMQGKHPFRATIINARGKTVFILVGSLVLSPQQLQAFLPQADRLVRSLRFP
jgi:hypothetical protein